MKRIFRWIPHGVHTASLNMAIDETLMTSLENSDDNLPILRFYSWNRPAITAGYFQDIRKLASKFGTGQNVSQVVRRLTGGGMVLHGKDLTFSLLVKIPDPLVGGDVKASYLKVNEALMLGLGSIFKDLDFADCRTAVPAGRGEGERICFEKPSCYDVMNLGKKVVGASQRRRNGVLLHQSAVFLEHKAEEIEKGILKGFEKKWGVEFRSEPLSAAELRRAEEMEKNRYGSREWALTLP